MRGTVKRTNKAITAPILVFGCERKLFTLTMLMGLWFFISSIPHLISLAIFLLLGLNVYVLRFIAKQDPQAANIFKKNKKFLIGSSVYVARGEASDMNTPTKLASVPISALRRV